MNYIDSGMFKWEDEQAQNILTTCVQAYQEVSGINFLIQKTKGIDHTEIPWSRSALETWISVLDKAREKGKLRVLIETMLADPRIEAHHANLRILLELPSVIVFEHDESGEPKLPEALLRLFKIIQSGGLGSDISPDLLRAARACQPSNLVAYRIQRIAYLLQNQFAIDKRFISLTLTYNQRGFIKPQEFDDIQDILPALPDSIALVLLGAPGAGKSTILRRLERDLNEMALKELNNTKIPIPFFISLNLFPSIDNTKEKFLPDAMEWLEREWNKLFPKMPAFGEIMGSYPVLLLLDGLNELPYKNRSEYNLMMKKWRELAFYLKASNHRIFFSCRNLDYTGSLSTTELSVPQIQVQPLTPEKIYSFIKAYLPQNSENIWAKIKNLPNLMATLNNPFFLKLLVEQSTEKFDIPDGSAALISGFVKKALQREVEHENWPFRPGELLSQQDFDAIYKFRDVPPHVIPGGGKLIHSLSTLAYKMQAGGQRIDGGQVRIDIDEIKEIIGDNDRDLIIQAGISLGVMDEDFEGMELLSYRETVAFRHQLFQEYFAARMLAEMDMESISKLVKAPWRADMVEESMDIAIATLPLDEPLPLLPQTGWEETVVLTTAMISHPEELLSSLINVNLPLAARCATQSDVVISNHVKNEIRHLLIERTQNISADLRHRISAGLSLGNLGDPRFVLHQGPHGDYLLPPMIMIPGGDYSIGSETEESDKDERNGPSVNLEAFMIGKFPVTNAEWKLFIKEGGYEDEKWWVTDFAKTWWRGESIAIVTKTRLREERKWLILNYDNIQELNIVSSEVVEACKFIAEMDDTQFEDMLEQKYPANRCKQPRHWSNRIFNNPSQPVVGVCLHEVQAYCAWISAQTNQHFRIPTEFEWEAAARGFDGRVYAYGNQYDPMSCNVLDTHIGHTTPIAVFPSGDTPEGLSDVMGNCWEWTTSPYRSYLEWKAEVTETSLLKIVRRGSCYNGSRNIRASSRYWNSPNRRNDYLGFRLVCSIS